MKPSDNPLSPFNKNYKCPIDWSDMHKAAAQSEKQSRVVNQYRKQGKEISISTPISGKSAHLLQRPQKLYVKTK